MARKRSTFDIVMMGLGAVLTLGLLTRVVFVLAAPRTMVTGQILAVRYEKNDINGGPPMRRVQYTFTRPDGGSRGEVYVLASVMPEPVVAGPIQVEVAKLGPFWRADVADFGIQPNFQSAAWPPLAGLAWIWWPVLWQRLRRKPGIAIAS